MKLPNKRAKKSWWTGIPTTLLRKTTLVTAAPPHRLAVHTLTFALPQQSQQQQQQQPEQQSLGGGGKIIPHDKIAIPLGDVVKMVIPKYKPKSYSVSALRLSPTAEFDVTFKVYPNGRASGYLDTLKVGDTIHSFAKSTGRVRNAGKLVGIVAYGVGITEALPVAVAELEQLEDDHDADDVADPHNNNNKVILLWATRTLQDTFWHDTIRDLSTRYPNRFQCVHIVSRQQPQQEGCLHGRIDRSVLERVFSSMIMNQQQARFLVVGTKEMMASTYDTLVAMGFTIPQHALLPKQKDMLFAC